MEKVKTFADLIAPLSINAFFNDHWEKCFLHLQHRAPNYAAQFSLRDIDRWFMSTCGSVTITPPEGSETGNETYRPPEINPSFAYAAYARGCSLIMDRMEDWPSLQGLAQALGGDFHASVSMEAFLTPQGAKSFPAHAAGYEIFILQLEGEKVWQLRETSLLQVNPVYRKTFKFPLEWYGRTKTPVIAEVRLKPGDLLYIPRGMPYQPITQDRASLYLYIRVTPLFWMDFLKIAAECSALHSPEIRRALPPGFVENREAWEGMRQTFQEVMRLFQELASFDEVLAAVKRDRIMQQGFPSDGHFAQLADLAALTAEAEVERRPGILCYVDEVFDIERRTKSVIFFGREQVVGPRHLRRALEFVRDHPRFRVAEIPGLDEKGQLTLVRRLIGEGLLRRCPPAP
jgi:hypothetical protein